MLRQQDKGYKMKFGELSEFLEARARRQGVPIRGQFELTPLCNLSCGMCYVHLNRDQMQGRSLLSVDQWKKLMAEAYEQGMFQAALTGGECLTYPGFDSLYLYLHSLGCQVDILTNGVLLDEPRLAFFREHPPALLQVTLYGDSEDTYERVTGRRVFHTVLENLHRVKEAGFPLSISITPNRALGGQVYETIRLADSLSDSVFINTSLFVQPGEGSTGEYPDDLKPEEYAEILRFYQELRGNMVQERSLTELPAPGGACRDCPNKGLDCGGGRSGFMISWKGEMGICNRLGVRSDPLRDGFLKAWQTIHETAENWPKAAECIGCPYEQVCGRCAAEALKYAEPGKRPRKLCERTKYMISKGVLPFHCSTK